MPVMSYNQVTL